MKTPYPFFSIIELILAVACTSNAALAIQQPTAVPTVTLQPTVTAPAIAAATAPATARAGDARLATEFARQAEEVGWRAFCLGASLGNRRLGLAHCGRDADQAHSSGHTATPLSRMRPRKLACETATLDNLSNGQVILAVGLGTVGSGFVEFGAVIDGRRGLNCGTSDCRLSPGCGEGNRFNSKASIVTSDRPRFAASAANSKAAHTNLGGLRLAANEINEPRSEIRRFTPRRDRQEM